MITNSNMEIKMRKSSVSDLQNCSRRKSFVSPKLCSPKSTLERPKSCVESIGERSWTYSCGQNQNRFCSLNREKYMKIKWTRYLRKAANKNISEKYNLSLSKVDEYISLNILNKVFFAEKINIKLIKYTYFDKEN